MLLVNGLKKSISNLNISSLNICTIRFYSSGNDHGSDHFSKVYQYKKKPFTKKVLSPLVNIQKPNIKSSLSEIEKKQLSREEQILKNKEKTLLLSLKFKQQKKAQRLAEKELLFKERLADYNALPDELKLFSEDPREAIEEKRLRKEQHEKEKRDLEKIRNISNTTIENTKKTINQLSILFGESSAPNIDKILAEEDTPKVKIEDMEMKVVEFQIDDEISIGLLYSSDNNYNMKVLKLIPPPNDQIGGEYKWKLVDIHYLDHINTWEKSNSITIKDLVDLDKKFKSNQYEFLNSFSTTIHKTFKSKFFNNKKLHMTSRDIACAIYEVNNEPSLIQCYFAFKYLSINQDIAKSNDSKGYRFVSFTSENLGKFIEKMKVLVKSNDHTNAIDKFSPNDYYFLTCLHSFALSPHDFFYHIKVHRDILRALNLPNTPLAAKELLQSVGFNFPDINDISTAEVGQQIDNILNNPESIPDPLAHIRVPFELPVITIDPATVFGVDDGFSIEETDTTFSLYVHITDLSRWIKIDDPLYKKAMISLKTSYHPQTTLHMFPIPFIKRCSLIRLENPEIPIYSITIKMDFDKSSKQMTTYKIFPTTLKKVTQLSTDQATTLVNEAIQDDSLSVGHNMLAKIYRFAKDRLQIRIDENNNYEKYGRMTTDRVVVRVRGPNRSNPQITYKKKNYTKAHEMVDEILSSADDAFSDFFEKHQLYGFFKYKGGLLFQKVTSSTSFVAVTSPLRNFTHLYSQFQLVSILKDGKAIYNWSDVSSIGNSIIHSLQLKYYFDQAISNHFLYKAIDANIEQQKSQANFVRGSKPYLIGRVISISEEDYTFTLHFPLFKVSTTANIFPDEKPDVYHSRDKIIPFKLNDFVNVAVEYFNVERQILRVKYIPT